MQRIVVSCLVVAFFAILSSGAARAWAANCGGVDPCNCGDTVVVDHMLPGDLTCDPLVDVDGLVVAAGVLLDLGGNDLTGPGPDAGGFGIQLNDGSRVRNGRIQNFGVGISSAGHITCAAGNSVTNLIVTINGIGIELDAEKCVIFKTAVVANQSGGVALTGDGNTLTQNTCSRNGGDGISIVGGKNSLLTNRCELNEGSGIVVDGNQNILERNLAGRNDGSGIVADGTGNVFRRNQGRSNGVDGVIGTGSNLVSDRRNFGSGNGGTNCEIDGFTSTSGGRYC
jgi:parallel beta-helix repeat protein